MINEVSYYYTQLSQRSTFNSEQGIVMLKPSTKALDHIVHLTPPGTVEEASRQFKDLGFTYAPKVL